MKIISLYLIIIVSIYSCADENTDFYVSNGLYNHKLILKDSIIYKYNDTIRISRIGRISKRHDNLFVTDRDLNSIFVLNLRTNETFKVIGGKGNGPGEYTATPLIIEGTKTLETFDIRKKKRYLYDEDLEFVNSKNINPEFIYNSSSNLYVNNKYILNSLRPYSINNDDYYRDYKSINIFNEDFSFYKEILKWEDIYNIDALSGYARNNLEIFCSADLNGNVFAIQSAVYYIHKINSEFMPVLKFGIKPLYYKKPPEDVKFEETQKSFETIVEYFSNITKIFNLSYDKKNKIIFVEYGNPTEEMFYKRDNFLAHRYLQIYNSIYDCICDIKIEGIFLFSESGKIYILAEEKPDFFKIKIYNLEKSE